MYQAFPAVTSNAYINDENAQYKLAGVMDLMETRRAKECHDCSEANKIIINYPSSATNKSESERKAVEAERKSFRLANGYHPVPPK